MAKTDRPKRRLTEKDIKDVNGDGRITVTDRLLTFKKGGYNSDGTPIRKSDRPKVKTGPTLKAPVLKKRPLATGITEGGKKIYGKAPKMGYDPKTRDPSKMYTAGAKKGKR
jgi:hypothetical protein